jgi:uncharacterized surface protein with fasciclin (FAS1) repeats
MIKRAITTTTLSLIAAALVVAPVQAGSCGASHAKAKEAQAILPLAEEAGFTTLVAAVKAAELDGVLSSPGEYTVFAPTDEAFAKLPEGTVEALLADTEKLKKVLLYHVVAGTVTSGQVVELESAATLNGEKIAINADKGVMINDATVVKADITASNGVVHVIDTVLIPENL